MRNCRIHGRKIAWAKVINIFQYCQDCAIEVVWDFMNFLNFKVNFELLKNCHCFMNQVYFIQLLAASRMILKNISSNYWQFTDPYKWIYDPIIGSLLHNLDYAVPDINVPIAMHLIQILDTPFPNKEKSQYISSSFWMPGRIFTTV